jgi:acetoin utilization protein AcuC
LERVAAAFVGSEVFRLEAFGKHHPLSIPRQSGVLDMCAALGWLEGAAYHECPAAGENELARFHDVDYIRALLAAASGGTVSVEARERYNIGTMENPLYPGLFQRAASTVGGSILAARLALNGHVAFHPAGGTHHGRPARAAGFCYFNDPVFAILTLLDAGLERVMYLDLDAHHGDGVQDAFAADVRVFTLSIHEHHRWPHTGPVDDRGGGRSRNLPVPAGFNDSELDHLMNEAVVSLLLEFGPEALVVTCGADALHGDPLSRMELRNRALWRAVEDLVSLCPRAVVLGGGGYNPWTVVRCWSGLWGRLAGYAIPDPLPPAAQDILAGFECDLLDEDEIEPAWLTTLADAPRTGPVRDEIRSLAEQTMRG